MDKQTLLRELKGAMDRGEVSVQELSHLASGAQPTSTPQSFNAQVSQNASGAMNVSKTSGWKDKFKHFTVTNVLYTLGALIVVLGLVTLVVTNWALLGTTLRILVTLGVGIAFYITGVLFNFSGKDKLGQTFFGIASIMIPIGLGVLVYEWEFEPEFLNPAAWVLGITYLVSLLSYITFKNRVFAMFLTLHGLSFYISVLPDFNGEWTIATLALVLLLLTHFFSYRKTKDGGFLFFTVASGAALYGNLIAWYLSTNPALASDTFYGYVYLVLGLALVSIGYFIREIQHTEYKQSGFWYFVGSSMFFISGFSLSGYGYDKSLFWEILLAGLITGAFFLSTYLKSRSVLIVSAIALVAYVIKITREYFVSSFGWPISLVVIGLALIGIGYLSVYLNRKYIKNQN